VGTRLATSGWKKIDQSLIDRFADVTNDRYFLHVDPLRALTEGPYGGTIAHGLLILSLVSDMAAQSLPVCAGMTRAVNYGFNRIRFIEPVRCGSRIRAHFVPAGVDARPASA
jgi:acyl dehydratase